MDSKEIIPYIEPIYRFCRNHLSNSFDAEDLAQDIILHILDGINKYDIKSFEAWVWRIAHNRYARFINDRNKEKAIFVGRDVFYGDTDYCELDVESTEKQYDQVFEYLHSLSQEYRNLIIDHYIGDLSVKQLSDMYKLPETTIKWRLNVGRKKIKERIENMNTNRIYKKINWNYDSVNGQINPHKYFGSQIARAILEAAYKRPVTIEEISLQTGIPALYIEDELPNLIYGDAIEKTGNKYATDFIIRHLDEIPDINQLSSLNYDLFADQLVKLIRDNEKKIKEIGFYGCEKEISNISHIIVHLAMRNLKKSITDKEIKLVNPPFPPRKDGGYGWFIVDEVTGDNVEHKRLDPYWTGNNSVIEQDKKGCLYYYWVGEYFNDEINSCLRIIAQKNLIGCSNNGLVDPQVLTDEDLAILIANGLVVKNKQGYYLNFPVFTDTQFEKLSKILCLENSVLFETLRKYMSSLYSIIYKTMVSHVPKRLESQIDQRVLGDFYGYLDEIVGHVIESLIESDELKKPIIDKSRFLDGVLYISGKHKDI